MKTRIVTGVLGGILFLSLVYLGGVWYSALVLVLAIVGLYEFLRMAGMKPYGFAGLMSALLMVSVLYPARIEAAWADVAISRVLLPVLLALLVYSVWRKNEFHIEHVALTIVGALYIGFGFHYMAAVRLGVPDPQGFQLTVLILLGIWSTDSGAYFIGKACGKRKLWPSISPNKTVEGSIGGLLTAVGVVACANALWGALPMGQVLAMAAVTGVAAQAGDLVESAMKRHFGVKDSGQILPGHGGVLDRFDSLLMVFPILHLLGVA